MLRVAQASRVVEGCGAGVADRGHRVEPLTEPTPPPGTKLTTQ